MAKPCADTAHPYSHKPRIYRGEKTKKGEKNVTRKCDNNTVKKVIFHDGITKGSVTYQKITLALESIVFENSNAIANLECFNNGTLKDVVLPKNI